MKEVRFSKYGCFTVDTDNPKIKLQFLYDYNETYDLSVFYYDRCLSIGDLCVEVKRLSTVNRKANEFGVNFVKEF